MSISIRVDGRRSYIVGDTFRFRDRIRDMGAHWDAERKAWWTAKREQAQALVDELNKAASEQPAAAAQQSSSSSGTNKVPRDGRDSVVAGRVTYKGKTYYLAGRTVRGKTRYDRDDVLPVMTQDGSKALLYFRDASSQFWAEMPAVQTVKLYDRPQTIAGLARFAEQQKEAEASGEETCWKCRKHCTCGTSFCHHHHDGCDACGAES